jgi:hypothetical protein
MEELLLLFCVLVGVIVAYNSAREERNKLARSALLLPDQAPWMKLNCSGDDRSFMNLMGFSKSTFSRLTRIVFPENIDELPRRGRKPLLRPCDKLGLYLIPLGK